MNQTPTTALVHTLLSTRKYGPPDGTGPYRFGVREVARASGVNPATISRFRNKRASVDLVTADQILAGIRKLAGDGWMSLFLDPFSDWQHKWFGVGEFNQFQEDDFASCGLASRDREVKK